MGETEKSAGKGRTFFRKGWCTIGNITDGSAFLAVVHADG